MKMKLVNLVYYILLIEIPFIALLIILYDKNIESIFYFNVNNYYLIAILIWWNYKQSKINKTLILVWGIGASIYAIGSIAGIFFHKYYSNLTFYINYLNTLIILFALVDLFKASYLFTIVVFPHKLEKFQLKIVCTLFLALAVIVYSQIFFKNIDFTVINFAQPFNYLIYICNLSLLLVFWIHYTLNKLIFSEYISNILSVYTVIVSLEVLYFFSVQNDGYLHELGQYFNGLLNFILMTLWLARVHYIYTPESLKNEHYIENYNLLHGIVEKPRNGILYELYFKVNKSFLIIIGISLITFIIYIIYFNRTQIFIRLNILLLIFAAIISLILAVLTWYKRWYDAIGLFFRKRKK